MRNAKLWHQLDLLCRIGLDISTIANDLAALLRQLVGAEAGAIFWLDAQGMPAGFFHENSPEAVQELFLNEFERLFVGPGEVNGLALAQNRGRKIGHLVAPESAYFHSNTFNLLIRPSGHWHTLDMRIEWGGRAQAVVLLFRSKGQAFGEDEKALLRQAMPYVERLFNEARGLDGWQSFPVRRGQILVDAFGRASPLFGGQVTDILKDANLVGLGMKKDGASHVGVADFFRPLGDQAALHGTASLNMSIPGGLLKVSAVQLKSMTGGEVPGQLLIELEELRPQRLDVIRRVLTLKLSPLQREIALLAGLGHPRSDCGKVLGVSPEALKKHLRVIFYEAGASDWDSLFRILST